MLVVRKTYFVSGLVLSIIGWITYGRFVYINSIDPELTIAEYDQKYFSNYPSLIGGINRINITTLALIAASIVMITASGFLSNRSKVFAWIIQGVNITVLCMLVMTNM